MMKRILGYMAAMGLLAGAVQALEPKADLRIQRIWPQKGESLLNKTISEGCPVGRKDLRVVTVRYLNDKGEVTEGTLIVHRAVANDVLAIFDRLLEEKFTIHRIAPASYYDGNDDRLMKMNITSAFNCRRTTDGVGFSKHSWGAAIDLNPLWNPYVKGKKVLPPEGKKYATKRHAIDQPGLVTPGSAVVRIFKEKGWTWGGDWRKLKDYQHFEKKLRPE